MTDGVSDCGGIMQVGAASREAGVEGEAIGGEVSLVPVAKLQLRLHCLLTSTVIAALVLSRTGHVSCFGALWEYCSCLGQALTSLP